VLFKIAATVTAEVMTGQTLVEILEGISLLSEDVAAGVVSSEV
jgi:hypothetical protein